MLDDDLIFIGLTDRTGHRFFQEVKQTLLPAGHQPESNADQTEMILIYLSPAVEVS